MLVNKLVGPKGTQFSDGVKIGPSFWPNRSYVNPETGNLVPETGAGYSALGPGVFLSPLTTWSLNPLNGVRTPIPEASVVAAPANIQENGTLVIQQNPAFSDTNFTLPPWILSQSNLISGQFFYQMDWPRGVLVKKTGTGTGSVRISGYDYWGGKLTRTLAVGDANNFVGAINTAFYTITKVTVLNKGGNAWTNFAITPSNFFGFPYVLEKKQDLINASVEVTYYNNNNTFNSVRSINLLGINNPGAFPANLYSPLSFLPNNTNLFEATTVEGVNQGGDVRGGAFIDLTRLSNADQPLVPPANTYIGTNLKLSFTFLVRGNDSMYPIESTLEWPTSSQIENTAINQWKCVPRSGILRKNVYGVPNYFDPQDFE